MKTFIEPTFIVEIYIAGDIADIERQCAKYCMEVGLCVSVEPLRFIYTGGREAGAVVRLINYPRFPSSPETIRNKAKALAILLIEACCQWSALIVDREHTEWLTNRPEDNPIVRPIQ